MGHTVNFRTTKESYKDKRITQNPQEDWLIFENTHEAIIDPSRPSNRKIDVVMNNALARSNATPGPITNGNCTITMYRGISSDYSNADFSNAATHEFGHILGLDDAYILSNPPMSVMNTNSTPPTATDISKVIKAYATGIFQAYG